MPAAKLTPIQDDVLWRVNAARPHAIPEHIAAELRRPVREVQKALDALTRRNFVTPIGTYGNGCIYVATLKGKGRA